MDPFACMTGSDERNLESNIRRFLSSRGLDAVNGIRRMGRENLVDRVASVAEDMGIRVSVIPGSPVDSPDLILFYDWRDIDGPGAGYLALYPEADVAFGQDLCHQLPAVVRHRRRCDYVFNRSMRNGVRG